MIASSLLLPVRPSKPRAKGLTMVIDSGLPAGYFTDLIESAAPLIDVVKFGWGTAMVSPAIEKKIATLKEREVDFYFGGTLFEKHVLQDRFDEFSALMRSVGCHHVEVSNGTIELSNTAKASYIRKLADEFTVLSEVGQKDPIRSEHMPPSDWIDAVAEDLEAGASLVILEARESGRSGICRPDGGLRHGLIEDLARSGLPCERLLFEAPTTALQTAFVKRFGTDVNLGNVAPSDVIALETLRLGLRGDTLTQFEGAA